MKIENIELPDINEEEVRQRTVQLTRILGYILGMMGVLFFVRWIWSHFSQELTYIGMVLYGVGYDVGAVLFNFFTTGYIGPGMGCLLLGYILMKVGSSLDYEEEEGEDGEPDEN
jgi:hypothetical protein